MTRTTGRKEHNQPRYIIDLLEAGRAREHRDDEDRRGLPALNEQVAQEEDT